MGHTSNLLLLASLAEYRESADQLAEVNLAVAILVKEAKDALRDQVALDAERPQAPLKRRLVNAPAARQRLELLKQSLQLDLIDCTARSLQRHVATAAGPMFTPPFTAFSKKKHTVCLGLEDANGLFRDGGIACVVAAWIENGEQGVSRVGQRRDGNPYLQQHMRRVVPTLQKTKRAFMRRPHLCMKRSRVCIPVPRTSHRRQSPGS